MPTSQSAGTRRSGTTRGALASVSASVLFGGIFLLPPLLSPMTGTDIYGWRLLSTLPVVALIFTFTRRWGAVAAQLRRIRARPWLAGVVVVNGALLGVQMWLFGWAPQSGHGLDAALGYLLLPLVMVAVGALLHRERISPVRGAAVTAAGLGVLAAFATAGGLSWVTLVVALGYPGYFILRRHTRMDGDGAVVLELAVLVPSAVLALVLGGSVALLSQQPRLVPVLVVFALMSGTALVSYLDASRLLPFGLFGLLSYLEPVLLAVAAVTVLGEHLGAADLAVYGPIALALALLAVEASPWSHRQPRAHRHPRADRHQPRQRRLPGAPTHQLEPEHAQTREPVAQTHEPVAAA